MDDAGDLEAWLASLPAARGEPPVDDVTHPDRRSLLSRIIDYYLESGDFNGLACRQNVAEIAVTGTVHELVSPSGRYRWAWIDFLYWEGLTAKEKQAILAGVWHASREQGCIGILEWNKSYYAKGNLFRSRFMPYPHFIEMNAWVLNPELSLQGVESIVEQIV